MSNLYFEFDVDPKNFEKSVMKMEQQIKDLLDQMKKGNPLDTFAPLGNSIDGMTAKIKQMESRMRGLDFNSAEFKKLNSELKDTQSNLDKVTGKAGESGSAFSQIKNLIGFAAIAAGAKQLVGEIISVRSEFEKYEAVLTNTLGSETLAKQSMAELTAFAAKTPFALSELTDAYVRLTNYGLQPNMEEMKAYADLSAAVGKNITDFSEAVADATTGEMERLKEFGIQAAKEGDKIKFTFKGQTTEVDNTSDAIKNYLVQMGQMEGVAGSTDAIAKTLGGSISNLGDAWDSLMNAMGGESSGVFKSVIDGLNAVLEAVTMAVKSTETIRDEAITKSLASSKDAIKGEVDAVAQSLINNGMNEVEAKKRAVELHKKQLQEQITAAEEEYNKALENQKKAFSKAAPYASVDSFGLLKVSKDAEKAKNVTAEAYTKLGTLKGELDMLPALYADKPKPTGNTGEKDPKKPIKGTIDYIENEIKELDKKKGTFTDPKAEAANIETIKAKTMELEEAWLKVRDARIGSLGIETADFKKLTDDEKKDAARLIEEKKKKGIIDLGSLNTVDMMQSKDATKLPTTKQISSQLAPMKQMTEEQKKQRVETEKKLDAELKSAISQEIFHEGLEKTASALGGASELFDSMAFAVGQVDEDLGASLGKMSGIAGSAANFVGQLASGNWVGAISSGIGLLGTVIASFKKDNEELKQSLEEYIDSLLKFVSEQSNLLGSLSGYEYLKGYNSLMAKLDGIREKVAEKISGLGVNRLLGYEEITEIDEFTGHIYTTMAAITEGVETASWTTADWLNALNDSNMLIEGSTEDLLLLLEQQLSLEQQIADIREKAYETRLGFNSDDIASSVADGIMEGLKLAENGLGEFGESFEEVMKKAALQSLLFTIKSRFLEGFMKQFDEFMANDGIIDKDERVILQEKFKAVVEGGIDYFEQWKDTFGDLASSTTQESLKGQIKGITEQTAGALEGKMNSIHFNILDMKDAIDRQLLTLQKIEFNTSYNFHLEEVAGEVASLNKAFKTYQAAHVDWMRNNSSNNTFSM